MGRAGSLTFIVKVAIICLFGLSFILAVSLSFSLPLIFLALLVLPIVCHIWASCLTSTNGTTVPCPGSWNWLEQLQGQFEFTCCAWICVKWDFLCFVLPNWMCCPGLLESILDHKLEEGGAELEAAGQAADTLLEQHIERSLEKDSLSLVYLCRLCNKACKSRDECANHIEVRLF